MSIELFAHNQTAYEAAVAMLAETGKAAVVHPTGTGKSFIGFKLCEDNADRRVCWLSPSEYIFRTQRENLAASGAVVPENITFLTYAKLMLTDEAELAEIRPDYIVLDEFHRCGAEQWGQGVQRLLSAYLEAKLLGLSATNIRYLDNQRDMADELFEQLNDTLSASWDTMYEYAKRFYAEHGNLEVPRRYKTEDGYSLGNWIYTQRKVYAGVQYGNLDESRVARLEAIGMVWDSTRDLSWQRYLSEAKRYYNEHGDLNPNVSYVTPAGVKLGAWISDRREKGREKHSMERQRQLDALGMVWQKPDPWEQRYALAKAYYEERGDLRVPTQYRADGIWLAKWLNEQKQIYCGNRPGKSLTAEQVRRLEAIGMTWGKRSNYKETRHAIERENSLYGHQAV